MSLNEELDRLSAGMQSNVNLADDLSKRLAGMKERFLLSRTAPSAGIGESGSVSLREYQDLQEKYQRALDTIATKDKIIADLQSSNSGGRAPLVNSKTKPTKQLSNKPEFQKQEEPFTSDDYSYEDEGDDGTHVGSHDDYIAMVASRLHHMWRETRFQGDGGYQPRIKIVDGKEYDIANLEYKDLPAQFQYENRAAAESACQAVKSVVKENVKPNPDAFDQSFIEAGANEQHEAWIARNKEWADPELLVPYAELPEHEKDKDRIIIKEAVRLYKVWCVTMATRSNTKNLQNKWPPMATGQKGGDLSALLALHNKKS